MVRPTRSLETIVRLEGPVVKRHRDIQIVLLLNVCGSLLLLACHGEAIAFRDQRAELEKVNTMLNKFGAFEFNNSNRAIYRAFNILIGT